MLFTVLILLASASVTLGSWICPVFTQEQLLAREFPESLAAASIIEWESVITPVPLTDQAMSAYADWDYQINETLVLAPVNGTEEFYFCLDLGITPEEKRKLQSITINGIPAQPCSVIATFIGSHVEDFEEDLFMLRDKEYADNLIPYVLRDIDTRRARYSSEEEFWSSIPESASFISLLYKVDNPGEEVVIEASYMALGWTHITGAAPLFYDVLEPGLWRGSITGSSVTVDLSGISDRDLGVARPEEDIRRGDENLEFNMDGLDEDLPDIISGLTITPPGLQ